MATQAAATGTTSAAPKPTSTPTPDVEILTEPLWNFPLLQSANTLAYLCDVIIGRVTGIALPYDPEVGYGGVPPETALPGNPKAVDTPSAEEINRPPGRLFTIFSVEVTDPGKTALKAGSVINVGQTGGAWQGHLEEAAHDPLLEVGEDYILPMTSDTTIDGLAPPGYMHCSPFATFRIEGGIAQPVDPYWATMPGVKQIAGNDASSALANIGSDPPSPRPTIVLQ